MEELIAKLGETTISGSANTISQSGSSVEVNVPKKDKLSSDSDTPRSPSDGVEARDDGK